QDNICLVAVAVRHRDRLRDRAVAEDPDPHAVAVGQGVPEHLGELPGVRLNGLAEWLAGNRGAARLARRRRRRPGHGEPATRPMPRTAAALILTAGLAILAINTLRIGALLSWGPPGGGTASLGRF